MEKPKMNTLKLDMYQMVIDFLSANINNFTQGTSLRNALDKLRQYHKELGELYIQIHAFPDKSEDGKTTFRNELIRKVEPVVSMLKIFAFDHKKKSMNAKLQKYTPQYFKECSDIELIKAARKIWIVANKQGGYSLAYIRKITQKRIMESTEGINEMESGYGLTSEMVKNIEAAEISFIQSMMHLETELKEKNKLISNIKRLHQKSNDILENNIDLFMSMASLENQDLYIAYQQSRKIGTLNYDEHLAIVKENIIEDQNLSQQDDNEPKPEAEESRRKRKEPIPH